MLHAYWNKLSENILIFVATYQYLSKFWCSFSNYIFHPFLKLFVPILETFTATLFRWKYFGYQKLKSISSIGNLCLGWVYLAKFSNRDRQYSSSKICYCCWIIIHPHTAVYIKTFFTINASTHQSYHYKQPFSYSKSNVLCK